MHILVLPSWYSSPLNPLSGIFFRDQALALHDFGYRVGIIAVPINSIRKLVNRQGRWFNRVSVGMDEGIPTYRWQGWSWFSRWQLAECLVYLIKGRALFKRYVKEVGIPDVVHAHSALYAGILANHLKRRFGIPFVVTEHSSAYARRLVSFSMLRVARWAFCGADKRVFVSPNFGQSLENILGDQFGPWVWIPNMVADIFFQEFGKKSSNTEFRLLSVSMLKPNKGHKALLDAFFEAFQGNSKAVLRIGGDGPARNELENYAKVRGMSRKVCFLGALDRKVVFQEMKECDVFVLPSQYETFGIVLAEATACGKPVIATDCGGPACIVNRQNGLLVPTNDIGAMKKAMLEMYKTHSSYDRNKIRLDCYAKFSKSVIVRQLSRLYEGIACLS